MAVPHAPVFDPVLLRTFLVVAQTLNFTEAGRRLELSQPTVSQHVRRLEAAAGRQLIARDTREVTLTDNGEAMAGLGRTIMAAHDQAAAYFTGTAMRGRLRFGVADDLALTELPNILRRFRQQHPSVNLELTVTQTGTLLRRLDAGHLDLIFTKQQPGTERGRLVRRDKLVWVGPKGIDVPAGEPVPLVTYRAPSISRRTAIEGLEAASRTWKITCTTREINGVLAAVRAGLGIAVFPQSLIPSDLVHLSPELSLPELGDIDIVLVRSPLSTQESVLALSTAILTSPLNRH
ncbi:LysR substrate-binding domain-containing protein [Spelaeicoccus albus]|uniref:DNA-binding transcriptional LysR family regulator n=1 Tax=Spelaeicoccus albus TaxID=1280376 RepID=A0A7Z0A8G9_9MICO|nr:LysR substrate-binding domain-containing protein [Spelaeicoccus albus]NYI66352.1 DNA-binding transcriptional LysR family regulator [Spelaeicoccus albus]